MKCVCVYVCVCVCTILLNINYILGDLIMKKILIFLLMVAALATVSQAVVIDSFVNADFDSGIVSNPFDGFDAPSSPEIIGWTNYPSGALNDAGVEGPGAWWGTYETNSAFMSPGDSAYNMSSYVIEAGDVFNVSFVGKFWNWGGTGQWTVSLFYDNPANVIGSFTAAPGSWEWIPLSNATPIVATAPSVGGTLGILFLNTGTATSNLDEVTVVTVPLEYNSPANGATLISAVRTNADNDLVFTVNDPNITKVDVQFGTENDPNLTTKPAYKIVDDLAVTSGGQYTVNLQSLAADLLYEKTYYWKVVGYEPNTVPEATDFIAVPGPVWSFTTIPATPVFTVNPGKTGALELGSVSLTATATSLTALTLSPTNAIKWYKVGTPNVEITTGITETRNPDNTQATSILEISSLTPAQEGQYFATAANSSGTGTSTNGTIMIKKLLAQYLFEDNLNDNSGNGLDGTNQAPSGAVLTPSYLTGIAPATGKALDFNGLGDSNITNTTGNYVDLPDGFSDFSLGITITAWVYPTAAQNWGRIVEIGNGTDGASNSFYFTRVEGGSALRFENDNLGGAASSITTGDNGITLNAWQFLVIAINNNTTNNAVIYRNGDAVTTGTVTLPNVVTRTNCFIGKSEWYGDSLYKGQMDDVRIYNYGLSYADVAKLYTDQTPGVFICTSNPSSDITTDCRVNLADILALAQNWLGCERVPAESCIW